MELRTQVLTAAQWEQEIGNLIYLLQVKGKHELIVSYGWGCDLDMDDLYQEVPLPLSDLREWIVQAAVSGVFTLGEGTLHIRSQDKEVEFELCHEADIHVTTENKEMAQEVACGWTARGITFYEIGSTSKQ